jgi:23S rRNA-/tRNA-specific pseudouridylate synthase
MSDPLVLASDGDLVAIGKPPGWVVHAAMPEETHDLRAWLATRRELPEGLEPLHRLDRETSGIVLFAARPLTRGEVGRWFQEGLVQKTYLALVHGHAHRKGVIRVPLTPDHPGPAQDAVTRYRLVEALGGFSLLRVTPETGRKHQIRRHLHGIGLAVVGDDRYPPSRRVMVPAFPGRVCLHAAKLALPDGRVFEAPLPEDMARCVEALRVGARGRTG